MCLGSFAPVIDFPHYQTVKASPSLHYHKRVTLLKEIIRQVKFKVGSKLPSVMGETKTCVCRKRQLQLTMPFTAAVKSQLHYHKIVLYRDSQDWFCLELSNTIGWIVHFLRFQRRARDYALRYHHRQNSHGQFRPVNLQLTKNSRFVLLYLEIVEQFALIVCRSWFIISKQQVM